VKTLQREFVTKIIAFYR